MAITLSRLIFGAVAIIAALAVHGSGCDRGPTSQSPMKAQSNAEMTFYGRAVDENGLPLAGVVFTLVIESIPANWSFATRGHPHNYTTFQVVTDDSGRFEQQAVVHALRVSVEAPKGFRHLFNRWGQGDSGVYNLGYGISSWGDICYRSSKENPAVYVFVRDGVHEVSALPSRGGSQAMGRKWIPNRPAWPPEPSLKDVVQKSPSAKP